MGYLEQLTTDSIPISMTTKKKILWSAGIVILLVVGIVVGGGLYLIDFALRPENRGKNMVESETFMRKEYPQIVQWLDSLEEHHALRDTFILAPDGIRMHAFYAHASRPTARTAIIVHGYTDNAIRMFHIGYLYNHSLDYNILLPDLRYAGLTEGDAIQMGWLDRKDVMQWIDVAPALFGDSLQAVVHGISMGAATTMMLSGEVTPDYVTCFVEDCGYTSVWDQFSKELKGLFGLPPFPLLYTASWICQLQNGWNFRRHRLCRRWRNAASPCCSSMVTTMTLYRRGWCTSFMRPNRLPRSCGLRKEWTMPIPTNCTRTNTQNG